MTNPAVTLHSGLRLPTPLVARIAAWPRQADLTPQWLSLLPDAVEEMCLRWEVSLEPRVHDSMMTLVVPGHSRRLGPVILKASPLADEFRSEATALQLAAAPNVARVYDADLVNGVMLMERIVPGTQLRDVAMSDDDATRLAADSVRSMWRPVPSTDALHPLRRWMRDLFAWTATPHLIPTSLVTDAQAIGRELLESAPGECLLHGDFQHQNLLQRSGGDWAIIDPKGLVGDPGFDIAAWMYNPPGISTHPDYRAVAARRIATWSEVTGLDRSRLAAWAFTGAVLSACWSAEDLGASSSSWLQHTLRIAGELRRLLD